MKGRKKQRPYFSFPGKRRDDLIQLGAIRVRSSVWFDVAALVDAMADTLTLAPPHLSGKRSAGWPEHRPEVIHSWLWRAEIPPDEAPDAEEIEAMIAHATERRESGSRGYSADQLGERLGVTVEERNQIARPTIAAAGVGKAARTAARRQKAKLRQKAYRDRKREEKMNRPRNLSLEAAQPWVKLGIARSTYFKKKRDGTLPPEIQPIRPVLTPAPKIIPPRGLPAFRPRWVASAPVNRSRR